MCRCKTGLYLVVLLDYRLRMRELKIHYTISKKHLILSRYWDIITLNNDADELQAP